MKSGARSPLRLALDRHQRRRMDRIPTPTLLTGPCGAVSSCWRDWLVAQGRSMLALRAARPASLARQFLEQMSTRHSLVKLARARDSDTEVARVILDPRCDEHGRRAADRPLVDALMELAPLDAIAGVLDLLPHTSRPGLLVLSPDRADEPGWLRELGPFLADLACARPRDAIALAMTAESHLDSLPDRRWVHQLREGAVAVPGVREQLFESQLSRALGEESIARCASSIRCLLEDGVSPEVAAAYVAAAKPSDPGKARSAAEAFLFKWLDEIPELQGHFQLNGKLTCDSHTLEVDLLARRLRVAIELDGVFHFAGAEHYRRDRRKDRLLQRTGYLVLRFLSDDVLYNFDEVRIVLRDFLLGAKGGL